MLRPSGSCGITLGFTIAVDNKKYITMCHSRNRRLANTAKARLENYKQVKFDFEV